MKSMMKVTQLVIFISENINTSQKASHFLSTFILCWDRYNSRENPTQQLSLVSHCVIEMQQYIIRSSIGHNNGNFLKYSCLVIQYLHLLPSLATRPNIPEN